MARLVTEDSRKSRVTDNLGAAVSHRVKDPRGSGNRVADNLRVAVGHRVTGNLGAVANQRVVKGNRGGRAADKLRVDSFS